MPDPSGKKPNDDARREQAVAGLCADCCHAQKVNSDRGATFYLCARSFSDPSFAKYPSLPVRSCPGFEPERERP
jgi:hypothetical protein